MKRYILQVGLVAAMSLICHYTHAQTPQVIYVKKGAAGAANGTSWANAYPELRTALAAAASISGSKEIWVAQGEYKPTDSNDRLVSFAVPPETFLYGGFAGNEVTKDARDFYNNKTILSGDIGQQLNKLDNSAHVVTMDNGGVNSGVDGFSIKYGNGYESGQNNLGGGMRIVSTGGQNSPQVLNCEFIENYSAFGGGLGISAVSGGELATQVVNCKFIGNSSTTGGGATSAYASTSFVNCSFIGNYGALFGGGVAFTDPPSYPGVRFITNCTIVHNGGGSVGTAIWSVTAITIQNSIIWNNRSSNVPRPAIAVDPSSTIQNNIIQNGYGTELDKNMDFDPLFIKEPIGEPFNTIPGSNTISDYGDLRLKAGSPAIDRGDNSFLPGSITFDIDGQNRLVDFANIFGSNSLDLGAYEKSYESEDEAPPPIPQNLPLNYVLSYHAIIEGIKDESLLDNYPVKDVNRSIEYIDGLGRPMQSIAIQGSPSKLDMVQPIIYDAFGREAVKYLPFTNGNDGLYKVNPVGTNSPQLNFYTTDNTPTIDTDPSPYAVTVFEPSPLNRVTKQGAPGEAWQPETNRTINKEYLSNGAADVLLFEYDQVTSQVSATVNGVLTYYGVNQLFVNKTIDEHQNEVVEFNDKEGRVVLKNVQYDTVAGQKKYASTYYIYDDLGNLVVVLPPEGVKQYLSLSNQN